MPHKIFLKKHGPHWTARVGSGIDQWLEVDYTWAGVLRKAIQRQVYMCGGRSQTI